MQALSVDVGTSVIKAVAFDADGAEVAVARRASEVLRPAPGHAEQDMAAVWRGVVDTVRSALASTPGRVDLLSVTAQGDGAWLVDDDGEPVRPAILWSDGRNPGLVERWERDGTIARAFGINGSLTFPGLPNAILHWLREHEPERIGRTHRALYCGGWIFFKLTGELAVDESDASAPLLDVRSRRYSDELLELFELGWARRLLPEVRRLQGRVGALSAAGARELGLPEGLPVVMAPYDIASTCIGVGATAPGQGCSILGTTLCTEVVTDHVDTSGEPSGFTIAMDLGERYLRAYPTLSGMEVLGWAARLLGLSEPSDLVALAERAEPGAGGVMVAPYLSPAGERAPFLDPNARGSIVGLTVEHGPEHLARAVLEGLSYVVRDCLQASGAELTELRLCGGGANSDVWCRLIADVTGLPTLRSADAEVGAKGAYITGLVATGMEHDLDAAAARLVTLRDRFEPDAERHALYVAGYERFLELRPGH